jgi:hypothetical protein
MRFAQNLEVRNSKLGSAPKAFRSTAKPVSPESIRGSWICREDFGIERNQSFKEIAVTHNSVFAAHRLQCRMTTRKIDIRHFVYAEKVESGKQEPRRKARRPTSLPAKRVRRLAASGRRA